MADDERELALEKLVLQLAEALQNAVRTDWDKTGSHEEEDELVTQAEKILGVKIPQKK